MIRHIVSWNFNDDATPEQRAALIAELDGLPSHFPQMRNWTRGDNISRRDDTYAHAFVVDFDTEDDLLSYLNSAHHENFVAERWRPVVRNRAITSYECPSP
jgi:hypothetical protein